MDSSVINKIELRFFYSRAQVTNGNYFPRLQANVFLQTCSDKLCQQDNKNRSNHLMKDYRD